MVGAHDGAYAPRRFGSIGTLGFSNQVVVRYANRLQVIPADFAFAELGICSRTACSNDDGGQALAVELGSMVEPGLEYRRRFPHIFRRSEHHNDIRRTRLILPGLPDNTNVDAGHVS